MGQFQTLTPLQLQFVRILEMTPPQLEEEIKNKLAENPALEEVDNHSDQPQTQDGEFFEETASDLWKADYRNEEDIPYSGDEDSNNLGNNFSYSEGTNSSGYDTPDMDISLDEYLKEQISELKLSPDIKVLSEYIIGNIDHNGRLTRTLTQIYDDLTIDRGLDIPFERVEKAYNIVRGLDPAGVCFNDLRDCLLLQLNRMDKSKEGVALATTIVKDYFDLFSQKHYEQLCRALNIDQPLLKKAQNCINHLNPKPGAVIGYSAAETASSTIIPEFIVEVEGDKIKVNLAFQPPELAIDPAYILDAIANDAPEYKKQEYRFIKKHHDEAAEFIQLLEMRHTTLMKVISAIAQIQRPFFLSDDPTKIKPMVLKDVANLTKLDISVISRATSGKYLQTASGIYPLKLFFNERPVDDEDGPSIHAILEALKDLIVNEDKDHPLSDNNLCELLQQQGINIKRRTVTKYREKLGLPVARLRKEL